jgi:(p)ppGpp synthase/HD superfamily hydrolase
MTDEVSACAALLHDVVEDTPLTFDDLSAQGIPQAVLDALRLLTHDPAAPYMEYVQLIKDSGNHAAIAVKLADLRHNSDVSRLDAKPEEDADATNEGIDAKTSERLKKYKAAIELLESGKSSNTVYLEKEAGTG